MAGIAQIRAVVLDCPDPRALAAFYEELTGWSIVPDDDEEWVILRGEDSVRLCFQRAADHRPPTWPNPERPQQFHIDFYLGDKSELVDAEKRVLDLGATRMEHQPGEADDENFVVYADPAGHPFCLCW